MKKAIVAGDLDLLRPFQHSGIPVVMLLYHKNSPVRFSRYCHDYRVLPSPSQDPESALEVLLEVSGGCDEIPVLYYVEDSMLNLVQNNRTTLDRHYHLLMPDDSIAQACNDKAKFANFARVHGLPIPRQISSKEIEEGRDIHELGFPLVIKPSSHVGWFKSSAIKATGGNPSKIVLAKDRAEANTLLALTREFTKDFVVQEFIPGAENQIYSYHAFANENFEPIGWYVGRKIRCYPSVGGVSTYIELVHDMPLAELGRDILNKLRICGPVKMDFKKDPRTGAVYLLEINLRFNLWHHLGAACGVNLPVLAYRYFSGELVRQASCYRTDLRWMSFKYDMKAVVGDYLPSGECTALGYLRSVLTPRIHHVFAWSDPLPAVVSPFQTLGRQFAKLLRHRVE